MEKTIAGAKAESEFLKRQKKADKKSAGRMPAVRKAKAKSRSLVGQKASSVGMTP
jgi:hypothetical protein